MEQEQEAREEPVGVIPGGEALRGRSWVCQPREGCSGLPAVPGFYPSLGDSARGTPLTLLSLLSRPSTASIITAPIPSFPQDHPAQDSVCKLRGCNSYQATCQSRCECPARSWVVVSSPPLLLSSSLPLPYPCSSMLPLLHTPSPTAALSFLSPVEPLFLSQQNPSGSQICSKHSFLLDPKFPSCALAPYLPLILPHVLLDHSGMRAIL